MSEENRHIPHDRKPSRRKRGDEPRESERSLDESFGIDDTPGTGGAGPDSLGEAFTRSPLFGKDEGEQPR